MNPSQAIQAGQTYTIVGSALAYIAANSILTGALTTPYTQVVSVDTNEVTGVFSITVNVTSPPGSGTVADLLNLADQQLSAASGIQFGYLATSGVFPGSTDYATMSAGVQMGTQAVTQEATNIASSVVGGVASGIGAGIGQNLGVGSSIGTILLLAVAAFVAYEALS